MRRTVSTALVLAVILVAGCDAELPPAPDGAAFHAQAGQAGLQANHQDARPAVPIRGTCELAIQPAQPVGPGLIRQLDVGTCRISHLGRSMLVSDKIINLVGGTQTTDVAITAANSDMLYGNGGGTNAMVAPGLVAFRAELTITGGTGRFTGATGMIVLEGTADLANAQSRLTMAGTISY
jgi:hypothetical protein